MKVIKPQKLGVLNRVFENDDRFYFVVTILAFFPTSCPRSVLTEISLWPFVAKALGEGAILDEGLSKAHGEVLVHGKCFPPGGARRATFVRLELGSVNKKLAVVGDREWKRGVPGDPAPFTEMPIDWGHAFGGEGFAENPLGKGFTRQTLNGLEVHSLPNVELDGKLITSPRDRPRPAGFGPYDVTWPQRYSKIGTYDEEWQRTRFPGVAKDMDPTFFNTAPEDQRIDGYFRGDEAFIVENMHPSNPRLEGRLPGMGTRAFITHRNAEGEVWREVRTRLDTIHLFPNAERGVLVFRGMVEIAEDDAGDVVHLLVAAEDPSSPRSAEHYARCLADRLDKNKGALAALIDRDLMPSESDGWAPLAEKADITEMVEGEGLVRKRQKHYAEQQWRQRDDRLRAEGLDPASFSAGIEEEEEPPSLDDPEALLAFVEKQELRAKEARRDLDAKKDEQERKSREAYTANGLNYDAVRAAAMNEAGGPPRFSAEKQLEKLRDLARLARDGGAPQPKLEADLENPAYHTMLREQEQRSRDAYRRFGHYYPAASVLGTDDAARLRVEAVAARNSGLSLAGRDFTGVDLSNLDLAGMDFAGCFLEGANLAGACLVGADLTCAVLARANLMKADIKKAKLRDANLGAANLHEADFSDADLIGATFAKANLDRSRFRGASLNGSTFLEATMGAADFSGAVAHELLFMQADLSRVHFAGADLSRSRFIEVKLAGVDFSEANLTGVQFITAQADGLVLRGATLNNAVFTHGSSAIGADFSGASLVSANLRKTNLEGAKFVRAELDGADLSECDLRKADFYRAVARNALLMKANLAGARMVSANLMNTILMRADLRGTDLTGANLFRADLCRIDVDGDTKLTDALMTQARIVSNRRGHAAR